MAISYPTTVRNARMDLITTQAGTLAKLRIYTGPRPATAAAITTQTLLAELICNATFAPAASGGVLTLNAISDDVAANASGFPQWFRIVKTDGTTFVLDGSVGHVGSDLNFSSLDFVVNALVKVTTFTITEGNP